MDDGSTDDTAAVIEQFPDKRIQYVRQKRSGVSAARNHGIRLTRYPWIAFLDSDDQWQPSKLQRQLETLRNYPEFRVSYTNEIWIRNGRRVNQKKKHRKFHGWIYRHCLPLCLISPSSVLLYRNILDNEDGFDESFPVCEDYELWLRITCRNPVFFLDESLIIKTGGHSDQLSRSCWGLDRYRVRALEKSFRKAGLTPMQQLWTAAEIVHKAGILAAGYRNRGKEAGAVEYQSLVEKWCARIDKLLQKTPTQNQSCL